MKKLKFILIAALVLLASCQKAVEPSVSVAREYFELSEKGKSFSVNVTANCEYDVVTPSEAQVWLKVTEKTQNSITLEASDNPEARSRICEVQLCVNGKTMDSFIVGQAPGLLYPAPENTRFVRAAYFPAYQKQDVTSMPDDFLKTVDVACFAFATIQDDYTLKVNSGVATLNELVARCHGLGIKVVISFNGTWLDSRYVTMSQSSVLRKKFIDSLVKIVDQYGLDGVDNDWEYPSDANGSKTGNLYLMRELSNIYHAPGIGKSVTMAISSGIYSDSPYYRGIDDGVFDCVDWFGSMVYDDYSEKETGRHHSTYESMVKSYNYWVTKRGMPSSKFVGGIPAYGRPSGIAQSGNTLTYARIIGQGGDPDADEATVTTTKHPEPFTIYYNGRVTVRKKVNFCFENKCGGYFFWEAGQDLTDGRSLLRAAAEAVNGAK